MANRALTIEIDVDASAAKQELQAVDRGVAKLGDTAKSTGGALSTYDQQVQKVVSSKQALTLVTQQATGWYSQLNDAVANGHEVYNVAIQDHETLFESVTRGADGWRGYAETAKDAWSALKSINFSSIRDGINAIGTASGLTVANLGLMGTAGAVLATAGASWGIGRLIGEFTGLTGAIANATARLMGWNAAKEASLAAQDVINLAISRGGAGIVTATDALKFNTQWVQNNTAAWKEMADIAERRNAPKEFADQIESWAGELEKLKNEGLLPALKAGLESHLISVQHLADSYKVSVEAVQMYKQQLDAEADAHKRAESAAAKHRAEQERVAEQLARLTERNDRWTANMEAEAAMSERLARNLRGLGAELQKINDLEAKRISMQGDLMPDMGTGGFGMEGNVAGSGDTGRGFFGDLLGKVGGQLDPKAIFSSMIGGGLSGLISTGVGLAAQGVTSLFKSIFHVEEKEVNRTRQAFVDASGGLAALNAKAHDAGVTLDAMLNAKTVKDYQLAVDALTKAFDAQEQKVKDLKAAQDALADAQKTDFGKMKDIADKYGISLSALGPAFEANRLHDAASTIINDFDVLQRGGADVDAVLAGMKKPINDLFNDSIKAGIAIPENFRPWLEQLAKTGQLIDTNGDKVTDLSGIKFSDPIVTEFQKVIDKLQELIDKISGSSGLNQAITNIPDRTVHVGLEVDAAPDFGVGAERMHSGGVVLPFVRAHRGLAVDEVPIIAQRGEGILNRGAMRRIGGGAGLNRLNAGGGGGGLSVNVNIDSVRTELDERTAGDQIGRAVVGEMRRKGVRFSNR